MKAIRAAKSKTQGSTGGRTAQVVRGASTVRRKPRPTNPGTNRQTASRANFRTLQHMWHHVLTAAQRWAWGSFINGTDGRQAFVSANMPALSIPGGPPVALHPPPTNGNAELGRVVFTNSVGFLRFAWLTPPSWAGDLQAMWRLDTSRPVSQATSRPPSTFRVLTWGVGDWGTIGGPSLFLGWGSVSWQPAVGQRIFARLRARQSNGRLAFPWTGSVVRV